MFQGRKQWLSLLAMVTFAFSAHAQKFQTPAQPEAVPGEYVVQLQPGSGLRTAAMMRSFVEIKESIPRLNLMVVRAPANSVMSATIRNISNLPGVVRVEPNYIYRANRLPNDPDLTKLWGMNNEGQKIQGSDGRPGIDIGALAAWDIATGSRDMVVAVIDTGIDFRNPDLKDNIWSNDAEANGQAGVDDDNNGYIDDVYGWDFANNRANGLDDHGHGSHCAGTIGAKGDNSTTIVGVNWDVRMMPIKFLSASGSGSLDGAVKSIDYAITNGAKVLSNSWGGGGFSKILEDVIKKSHDQGTLFVAAAGNDGTNNDTTPTYPANYNVPNVISVAAIDNKGDLADFSCYGLNTVHLGAPGVDVYSTIVGRNGFDYWSGTSMATPHVSGVAALLWAHNPGMTNVEVRERLLRTARPIASLSGKVSTGGIVNAYHALTNTIPPADPNDPANWPKVEMKISSPHPYDKNARLTWELQAPAGTKRFAIYFSKFATERRYDVVQIRDAQDKVIANLSGRLGALYTPVIEGEYAKITLTADDSVQDYGFDIEHIAIGEAQEGEAVRQY
jgi:thermitase